MREDAFSGGSGAGGITTKNAGDVLAFNAMPQDSPSPAFVVGVQPSGSQSATTAIFRRPPRQTKKQNREDLQRHLSRPEVRDAFRRQWENAKNKADSIVRSAENEDYVEIRTSATDLRYVLQDMWGLRDHRQDEWVGVLNFVQGILQSYEPEDLTAFQARGIRTVVEESLGPGTVNKDDVKRCLQVLQKAGLDPWRPISGNPRDVDDE